ncbi:MAG: hypothetical protein Q9190_001052 [Brigantiaea leucoxantha]
MVEYQYLPLEADEIRLLQIAPGDYERQELKAYINVTSSLYKALLRVRDQATSTVQLLWADAISINQKDVFERNTQVRLMRRIYEYAHTTWIYLGEEADESHRVPDLIARILEVDKRLFNTGLALTFTQLPPLGDAYWKALNALLRRPWFSRVWVIQEAALAKNGIILCGSWNLLFKKFSEATAFDLHQSHEIDVLKIPASALGRQQLNGIEIIRRNVDKFRRLNILGLLKNARMAWASEPVDYLYGILGIAQEGEEIALQPNYSEPLHDTLRRYAKHFVMTERAFEMLGYVNCAMWAQGQPTWIPSWASHSDCRTMWGLALDSNFNAAGSSSFEMTLVDNAEMNAFWLVAKGVLLDSITVAGYDRRSERDQMAGSTISSLPRDQIKHWLLEPDYLMSKAGCRSFYRTVNEWADAKASTIVVRNNPHKGYDDMTCYHILTNDVPPPSNRDDRISYEQSILDFISSLYGAMDWSTLCVTKNGLLGRVPYGSEPGDMIVIFAGAKLPFVLRRRQGEGVGYMVLGPCYIHGAMHGEFADALKSPKLIDLLLN